MYAGISQVDAVPSCMHQCDVFIAYKTSCMHAGAYPNSNILVKVCTLHCLKIIYLRSMLIRS